MTPTTPTDAVAQFVNSCARIDAKLDAQAKRLDAIEAGIRDLGTGIDTLRGLLTTPPQSHEDALRHTDPPLGHRETAPTKQSHRQQQTGAESNRHPKNPNGSARIAS